VTERSSEVPERLVEMVERQQRLRNAGTMFHPVPAEINHCSSVNLSEGQFPASRKPCFSNRRKFYIGNVWRWKRGLNHDEDKGHIYECSIINDGTNKSPPIYGEDGAHSEKHHARLCNVLQDRISITSVICKDVMAKDPTRHL